jgi:spore coat polysaccharide biosynthesis protein SpsF
MGSTRLPGKALADICGTPLLGHILKRTRVARAVDSVVVATTDAPEDQAILDLAAEYGVHGFAGSRDDVLDRSYRCAREAGADVVVRVTADDPLKDPRVIDRAVGLLHDNRSVDYVSNTIRPTFPEGLDVEVFTFGALERAWSQATLSSDREHVTPYIWRHPSRFNVMNFEHEADLSHLRWTIDHHNDLAFARAVYTELDRDGLFYLEDVLRVLERNPALSELTHSARRNEGYLAALAVESSST